MERNRLFTRQALSCLWKPQVSELLYWERKKKVSILTIEHEDCWEVTSLLGPGDHFWSKHSCFEQDSGTQNNQKQMWMLSYLIFIFKSGVVQLCFWLKRQFLSLQMLLWASDYCKTANNKLKYICILLNSIINDGEESSNTKCFHLLGRGKRD